jgi:hypothetical protein
MALESPQAQAIPMMALVSPQVGQEEMELASPQEDLSSVRLSECRSWELQRETVWEAQ